MASGREMQQDSQLEIDGILMSLLSEIEKNDPRQDLELSTPEIPQVELQPYMGPPFPENRQDSPHQNLPFFSPEVIQDPWHQDFVNPFIENQIFTFHDDIVSPDPEIGLSVLQQNPALSHDPRYQQTLPHQDGIPPIPKNDVALHQLLMTPNLQTQQASVQNKFVSFTPDNQQGALEQCVVIANLDNQLFLEQCIPPPNPGIKRGSVQENIVNFNSENQENAVQEFLFTIPSTTQIQQVMFSSTPEIPIVKEIPHPDSSVASPNPQLPTPEPSLTTPESHPISSTVGHKAREPSEMSGMVQSDKKYQCPHCAYGTNRKGDFNIHQLKHTGEKPHLCEVCGRRFSVATSLRSHIKNVHCKQDRRFSCFKCKYFTTEEGVYFSHVRTHFAENPRDSRTEPGSEGLVKMQQTGDLSGGSRSSDDARDKPGSDNKRYQCQHCAYAANFMSVLNRHHLTHSGVKPHMCEFCDRTFSRLDSLKIHTKHTHTKVTKDRLHACGECGYATPRSADLHKHMASHTGERKFSCPHCGYNSTTRGHMESHIRRNHADGKVASNICKKCGAAFGSKKGLSKHESWSHQK